MPRQIPTPTPQVGLSALKAILREHNIMAALSVFHREIGEIFRINAPGFKPVMLAGPDACRWVLVEAKDDLLWRMDTDPITQLLSHGLLVEDGAPHDDMRERLNPMMHRRMVDSFIAAMVRRTDEVIDSWADGEQVDLLKESRRMALLILMDTLFDVNHSPDEQALWPALMKLVGFISPGLWMFWSGIPRPGYQRAITAWNDYFARMIARRRAELAASDAPREDMLSLLIGMELPDEAIRDQLMTMLIAGHDTVTALLGWAFYELGRHPHIYARCTAEADSVLTNQPATAETIAQLKYTAQVVDETLRLYPPAHLGSRKAARDLDYRGYHIPAGARVVYSIYLTQRDEKIWPDAARFAPERFAAGQKTVPYSYLPFGGGKRNCIGAYFGQIEARIVIARVLQRVTLTPTDVKIHMHMGATIEPRPGVMVRVTKRR